MKILIVYYSLYGHVLKLAQAVKEGAESVKGAEVLFRRVEEFDVVLKKTADDKYLSQVREQQKDIPVCTLDDLRAADGVIIGSPTRYGNMTAQMKQLIDSKPYMFRLFTDAENVGELLVHRWRSQHFEPRKRRVTMIDGGFSA
jgi:multimeric flavodoxin WrbA